MYRTQPNPVKNRGTTENAPKSDKTQSQSQSNQNDDPARIELTDGSTIDTQHYIINTGVWVLAGDHAEARVAPDEWARRIERIIPESDVDFDASSVALDIAIRAIKRTHIGLSAKVFSTYSLAVQRDSVRWETEETDAEEVLG